MRRTLLLVSILFISMVASSQMITIGTGTTVSGNVPITPSYRYGWSAVIYKQSEINLSGEIYAISVHTQDEQWVHRSGQKIFMAHTPKHSISETFKPNPDTLTQVFSGEVYFEKPGWNTIVLDTPFPYNNAENLFIYWENHSGSNSRGGVRFSTTAMQDSMIYQMDFSTFPETDGRFYPGRPNIQLNFPKDNDVSVKSWNLPVTAGDLTNSELVQVTVENMGKNAVSNFPISYSLDGGNAFIEETFTGTLQPMEKVKYTFTTPADFSVEKTYNCVVKVGLEQDEIAENNSLESEVTHLYKGADCSDPIHITLPVNDLIGSTKNMGDDYVYGSLGYKSSTGASLPQNWLGSNDVVYEFTVEEGGRLSGEIRVSGNLYANPGIFILKNCPDGKDYNVVHCSYLKGNLLRFSNVALNAGTYKVVIDAFPSRYSSYTYYLDLEMTTKTDFSEFFFPEQTLSREIDTQNHTVDLMVNKGADVTNLIPKFTLLSGSVAKIGETEQQSEVSAVDFSSPVTYTVYAADGVTSQDWTINVTSEPNEAPTGVFLSKAEILENEAEGTVIGDLSATDPDNDAITFSLVDGERADDNALFAIEGNQLKTATTLDFEAAIQHAIRIKATDAGNLSMEKSFLISVINQVETAIGDHSDDNPLLTFPNPTRDNLNMELINSFHGKLQVSVISIVGKKVLSFSSVKNEETFKKSIDVSHLKAGTYVLEVNQEGRKSYLQFIKL